MKERIIEFLRAENKSSSQFAEEIGVQPSGISHIISGRNKPSLDFVVKMLEKYPYISMEWLLFGKGSMYASREMQDLFTGQEQSGEQKSPEIVIKQGDKVPGTEKKAISSVLSNELNGEIDRIVLFFRDGTFSDYKPGRE